MPKGKGYVQGPDMTGAKKRSAPGGVDPVRGIRSKRKKSGKREMMAPR